MAYQSKQVRTFALIVWTSLPRRASLVAIRATRRMREEDNELIRRLFVAATALLEDAHELATTGQAERLDRRARYLTARRLRRTAQDVETLSTAASVLMRAFHDE